MLTTYPEGPLAEAVWIDLLQPAPEEIAAVEAATGVRVPSHEALAEIESSSRLRVVGRTLFLSTPLLAHGETPDAELSPLGLILSERVLVTVRFARVRAFEIAAEALPRGRTPSSSAIFTTILEALVDRMADLLEIAGGEIDTLSRRVFRNAGREGRRIARANARLRLTLSEVGQIGDRLGKIRGSLLGVGRLAPFAGEAAKDWLDPGCRVRLKGVRTDVRSLADYESHLDGKNQFLLDAVLGFINTEQNDLFKILTIVSVVGVPPTLVASIYGMNFIAMPELHWPFGYAYALGMIVLSAVLPMVWFKWKGWW